MKSDTELKAEAFDLMTRTVVASPVFDGSKEQVTDTFMLFVSELKRTFKALKLYQQRKYGIQFDVSALGDDIDYLDVFIADTKYQAYRNLNISGVSGLLADIISGVFHIDHFWNRYEVKS